MLFFKRGIYFGFLSTFINTASSAALSVHCVGGYWDRTQDCYEFDIDSPTRLLSLI
jgi:hypothetical protein